MANSRMIRAENIVAFFAGLFYRQKTPEGEFPAGFNIYTIVKMVVETQLRYIQKTGDLLFDNKIVLERFGPVIPDVNDGNIDFSKHQMALPPEVAACAFDVFDEWKDRTSDMAFNETHKADSLWGFFGGRDGDVSEHELRSYALFRDKQQAKGA